MKLNKAIGYVMAFCSYAFSKDANLLNAVKSIILFGSAAKGQMGKESDIDLFFEIKDDADPREIEKNLESIEEQFYKTDSYQNNWRFILRENHPFSFKAGIPYEWESIYPALLADGITLYGIYASLDFQGNTKVLYCWENVKGNDRVNLHRSLFGYKARGKEYTGLLERINGERLSKGAILVPLDSIDVFRAVFKKHNIHTNEKIIVEA